MALTTEQKISKYVDRFSRYLDYNDYILNCLSRFVLEGSELPEFDRIPTKVPRKLKKLASKSYSIEQICPYALKFRYTCGKKGNKSRCKVVYGKKPMLVYEAGMI